MFQDWHADKALRPADYRVNPERRKLGKAKDADGERMALSRYTRGLLDDKLSSGVDAWGMGAAGEVTGETGKRDFE